MTHKNNLLDLQYLQLVYIYVALQVCLCDTCQGDVWFYRIAI